jgi:hypothetical protein
LKNVLQKKGEIKMAEFNNNPTEFVDFNDLFPVLNEKVGLTYEQWRKAVENINFVKNNLGVSDIEVGKVNPSIVDNDSLVGVDITTREGIVEKNGVQRTVIYLDFDLRFPAGKVKSVNGKMGVVELTATDIGAVQSEIDRHKIINSDTNTSIAYASKTNADTKEESYGSSVQVSKDGVTITSGGGSVVSGGVELYNPLHILTFTSGGQLLIDGRNVATKEDITNAIGNVSALLGNTEDLEV